MNLTYSESVRRLSGSEIHANVNAAVFKAEAASASRVKILALNQSASGDCRYPIHLAKVNEAWLMTLRRSFLMRILISPLNVDDRCHKGRMSI